MSPDVEAVIIEQTQASVRQFPEGYAPPQPIIFQVAVSADEAPMWGDFGRDTYLRTFWQKEPWLASAIYSLCARNAGFRWEIECDDDFQKRQAINLLRTAEFGEGWSELVLKVSEDLYTQDAGGFIEVIRPARARVNGKFYPAMAKRDRKSRDIDWFAVVNRLGGLKAVSPNQVSDSPLDLPIGLAHLDASKCTRTGDPDRPVIYTDRYGTEHNLESWQVITLSDMPSPIEEMHGVGFCMVSRVLRLAQTIRDWQVYREEKISGRFARSVILTNVDADTISDAIERAMARSDEMGLLRYTQPVVTNTLDPNAEPHVATIPLASLPDGFSEDEAMRWYVGVLALAAGEHYSFFAPMPGRRLGSAKEVEVQERQARGKSSRLFMEAIIAKFTNAAIFPPGCTLVFKEKDPEEQAANETAAGRRAQTRSLRIASGEITPEIARQIAVDEGDLREEYLVVIGEHDVTPENGDSTPDDEDTESGEVTETTETEEVTTFGEKEIKGQPPKPWGDKAVPISKEDIARAIGKWDERMPPEARGILQARLATEEEEIEEEPELEVKGGEGSGHFEHEGRPGEVGGSEESGRAEPERKPSSKPIVDADMTEQQRKLLKDTLRSFPPRHLSGLNKITMQPDDENIQIDRRGALRITYNGETSTADGIYDWKGRNLYVSPEIATSQRHLRGVLAHEVGHHLMYAQEDVSYAMARAHHLVEEILPRGEKQLRALGLRLYSTTDSVELWADAYKAWLFASDKQWSKLTKVAAKAELDFEADFGPRASRSRLTQSFEGKVPEPGEKEGKRYTQVTSKKMGSYLVSKLEPVKVDPVTVDETPWLYMEGRAGGEKGGEGSGHFDHPGRPGKVGGSEPTGRAPEEPKAQIPTATEPETRVGITSDRPLKSDALVRIEMDDFAEEMEAAGIKDFNVIFGRGGYDGGGEATWVVSYNGDGEAKRIILEYARKHDQDSVLFMYRAAEGTSGATPKTSFKFGSILSDQEITRIEKDLATRGVGGWTWYNGKAGSSLMIATVTQWGGDPAEHTSTMTDVLGELQSVGYPVQSETNWTNNEVVERSDYDLLLGSGGAA